MAESKNESLYDGTLKATYDIPIFNQSSEAIGGIHIVKLPVEDAGYYSKRMSVHRDYFFIFFVLTGGQVIMLCDTMDVEIRATGICFVKPFQIHSVKQVSPDATGYFISIAPFLIPNLCAQIFQNIEISEQGRKIEDAYKEELLGHIALLLNAFGKKQSYKAQIINGLFNALIYNFANIFRSSGKQIAEQKNQSAIITSNFKKLIHQSNFLQAPGFFANKLNISTSHLNDCVNSSTGKSVTYWLQNAMVTEAQRLLYYTENDVKQIAYNLGFEDHSYFSRLFKKICNETPLAFRKKFRE